MKIKCKNCGYENETKYKHDICKKCFNSVHSGKELPSYFYAIENKEKKLIKKIEEKMEKGEIVRLI